MSKQTYTFDIASQTADKKFTFLILPVKQRASKLTHLVLSFKQRPNKLTHLILLQYQMCKFVWSLFE
jgi:hypothetical protein